MLMSQPAFDGPADFVDDDAPRGFTYPQLAGKRILITGVTSAFGVDIVRAFAEHKTDLVVEMAEQSEATQAIAEMAAEAALSLTLFDQTNGAEADVLPMARRAIATHGGIDAVINLIPLKQPQANMPHGMAAIEAHISAIFLKACLVGRVAANRMRVTQTSGVILNITAPLPDAGHLRGFHALARATLETLTKGEARNWADEGIRFNAIAPVDDARGGLRDHDLPILGGEPEMAELALFLATGRGRNLSGITFDSALV
jgi:3-oxoacyl-[acyl-carrier protein] reductase